MQLVMEKPHTNKRQNARGWVLAALLCVVILAYSSIYFANTMPITEGWNVNYAELALHGKFPYRDFYYYLPPLNILIDVVLWKLSFGSLFIYRAWWLVQRIAIYELMFRLLCRYFNQYAAFAACAFSAILCTASVYDLFGDYNQTVPFLSVLLLYCVLGFTEAADKKAAGKYLFAAGAMLGLLFLNKQTIFVAGGGIYLLALSVYCWKKKDKGFLQYCAAVILGFLLVFVVAMGILAVNGALLPFFEQVFMHTGGKGGPLAILLNIFTGWTINAPIFLLMVGCVTAITLAQKNESQTAGRMLLLLVVGGGYVLERQAANDFIEALFETKSVQAVVIGGGLLLLLAYSQKRRSGSKIMHDVFYGLCAAYVVIILVTARYASLGEDNGSFLEAIYESGTLFKSVTGTLYTIISFLDLYLIARSLVKIKADGNDGYARERFWMACAAFSTIYAASMTSAGEIPYYGIMLAMSFVLCVGLNGVFADKVTEKTVEIGTIALCTVLSMACIAQKVVCSYSWWGCEQAEHDKKIYATGIPALRGFRFSAEDDKMLEDITQLILDNTTEDATIFGYPYVKLFNILTNRYTMDTFVPVLFYDVVDDQYVLQEDELLQENLPDIVIWKDDVPNCKKVHEETFRNGKKLKQRELEKNFGRLLCTRYTLLGVYGEERTGKIKVYKLTDETDWDNFTLEGKGTEEEPYLIQSAEDLQAFSNYVNRGMSFADQYVEQTADIDMDGKKFTPIGAFSGESYFYGTYNGKGHVICNLTIRNENKENVGLFGRLGGAVYNLGLEGGSLDGACVGAIASHAVGSDARIVNCFTDMDVTALRAGGIADNFSGSIVNCVSAGVLNGEENAAAISYNNTLTVDSVYQLAGSASSLIMTPSIQEKNISSADAEALNSDYLVERLTVYAHNVNANGLKLKKATGETGGEALEEVENSIELVEWTKGTDGHPVLIPEN